MVWTSADAEKLQRAALALNKTDVSVHVRDPIAACRNGIAYYIAVVEQNRAREKRVQERVDQWFVNMDKGPVLGFLDMLDASGTNRPQGVSVVVGVGRREP